MTMSLVARDPASGAFGIIVCSSSPAVAARCAHPRAGVGVVASQNVTNPALGPAVLDRLSDGLDAEKALTAALSTEQHPEYRQVSVVDAHGHTALHSGARSLGTYGGVEGYQSVAAGNMLADLSVLESLLTGYADSVADAFEQRLLDGLRKCLGDQVAAMLADDWNVGANVYSVTSWNELARDGIAFDRAAVREPGVTHPQPYVTEVLAQTYGPSIAVSDYMRGVQEQIRAYVPGTYLTLGTDGFGFSDTRPAARRVFNVDAESIVVATLVGLARDGNIPFTTAAQAAEKYRITDVNAAEVSYADTGSA